MNTNAFPPPTPDEEVRRVAAELRRSMGLYTDSEVAAFIGHTPDALMRWRSTGRGPAFVKMGKFIFYRRDDIEAWIMASRKEPETLAA